MRTMRKVKYFLAFFLLFCMATTFPSFAEDGATVEWNGKTALKKGVTYTVSKSISVKSDFSLPENSELIIKDGGKLSVGADIKVNLRGKLTVEAGGTFAHKYGLVTARETSTVNIKGEYLQYVDTELRIQTKRFTISESGGYMGSSVFKVYPDAKITNKGFIAYTKSSDVYLSSDFDNSAGSEMRIQGQFSVTLSGSLINNGHISIGRTGILKVSGEFVIERESTFTRIGQQTKSKSGIFIDYRATFKYEDMTVSILVDEPRKKIQGIDVSVWNGDIDWDRVAADGIDFAIIRAGRGNAGDSLPMAVDANFVKNIEGAVGAGIDAGVYFYSYALTVSQARKEAEFLVKTIAPYKVTYPVILDMEDKTQLKLGKKKLTDMVEAFFEVLMDNGYFPMVYSYKSWLEDNLDMTRLDRYAVWVAHTGVSETTYKGGYYIWQYSHTGRVDGIKGEVDLNISYRDFPKILKKYNLNKLNK